MRLPTTTMKSSSRWMSLLGVAVATVLPTGADAYMSYYESGISLTDLCYYDGIGNAFCDEVNNNADCGVYIM